jgi:hypothetical protein
MEQKKSEDLARRFAPALRGIDSLRTAAVEGLPAQPAILVAFIGDEIVVDATRLPKGSATMVGFARDPFRPQVKILTDNKGTILESPLLTNTWELDSRGQHARAVVEAVDPEEAGIDPLKYLDASI